MRFVEARRSGRREARAITLPLAFTATVRLPINQRGSISWSGDGRASESKSDA